MPTLTISKNQHRFDNTTKPVLTATGLVGGGRLLVADQFSGIIGNGGAGYTWNALNRTIEKARVLMLDTSGPTWTKTGDVVDVPGTNGLVKNGVEGFNSGAFTGTLNGDIGIEAVTISTNNTCGISLQSGAIAYNYFYQPEIEHALIFGQSGVGGIWELGQPKATFSYLAGDSGLILREGGIVKYYLVKAGTGELILLRSTRSKLAAAATPVVLLYHNGAQLNSCFIWAGGKAETFADVYGVLSGEVFENWQNAAAWESLAEKTMNKSKQEDFTYFTDETNLMTLSLDLDWRFEDEYLAFQDFFWWHDLARPFIFVGKARKKLSLRPAQGLKENEMFARFVSSFKDNPLGTALYGISVDLRQMIEPPILFV